MASPLFSRVMAFVVCATMSHQATAAMYKIDLRVLSGDFENAVTDAGVTAQFYAGGVWQAKEYLLWASEQGVWSQLVTYHHANPTRVQLCNTKSTRRRKGSTDRESRYMYWDVVVNGEIIKTYTDSKRYQLPIMGSPGIIFDELNSCHEYSISSSIAYPTAVASALVTATTGPGAGATGTPVSIHFRTQSGTWMNYGMLFTKSTASSTRKQTYYFANNEIPVQVKLCAESSDYWIMTSLQIGVSRVYTGNAVVATNCRTFNVPAISSKSPTPAPSPRPTPSPTPIPTKAPRTSQPTPTPTKSPSSNPTRVPTKGPSLSAPTSNPTSPPTFEPTTTTPTPHPTTSPTISSPSVSPTLTPTTSSPTELVLPSCICSDIWDDTSVTHSQSCNLVQGCPSVACDNPTQPSWCKVSNSPCLEEISGKPGKATCTPDSTSTSVSSTATTTTSSSPPSPPSSSPTTNIPNTFSTDNNTAASMSNSVIAAVVMCVCGILFCVAGVVVWKRNENSKKKPLELVLNYSSDVGNSAFGSDYIKPTALGGKSPKMLLSNPAYYEAPSNGVEGQTYLVPTLLRNKTKANAYDEPLSSSVVYETAQGTYEVPIAAPPDNVYNDGELHSNVYNDGELQCNVYNDGELNELDGVYDNTSVNDNNGLSDSGGLYELAVSGNKPPTTNKRGTVYASPTNTYIEPTPVSTDKYAQPRKHGWSDPTYDVAADTATDPTYEVASNNYNNTNNNNTTTNNNNNNNNNNNDPTYAIASNNYNNNNHSNGSATYDVASNINSSFYDFANSDI